MATPSKNVDITEGDGRRRVGVREVKGEMTCVVLGKGKDDIDGSEGIMLSVEYKGTCKGVWFGELLHFLAWMSDSRPKGLMLHGCKDWNPSGWLVVALGYTGFDTGAPPNSISRRASKESPGIFVLTVHAGWEIIFRYDIST